VITRGLALLALAWGGAAAAAGPASVPFVGCPSDGHRGRSRAARRRPAVPARLRAQLAYYASGDLGVLAPRGWHCFGLYGSNGSILIVTPEPHGARDLLASPPSPLRGPAVQISSSSGGTSGRFEVANVIARAFPAQMAFARRVAAEGIGDPLPRGPYPTDHMVRLRPNAVGYTTPAGREGLGTDSRLVPSDRPIDGLAVLDTSGDWNLLKLDVRLSAAQAGLATPILNGELPRRGARR
jgi:hypothetical protein